MGSWVFILKNLYEGFVVVINISSYLPPQHICDRGNPAWRSKLYDMEQGEGRGCGIFSLLLHLIQHLCLLTTLHCAYAFTDALCPPLFPPGAPPFAVQSPENHELPGTSTTTPPVPQALHVSPPRSPGSLAPGRPEGQQTRPRLSATGRRDPARPTAASPVEATPPQLTARCHLPRPQRSGSAGAELGAVTAVLR